MTNLIAPTSSANEMIVYKTSRTSMKRYPIGLEISAQSGMFSDPGSGSNSSSLPVPPPTAVSGLLRSIHCNPLSTISVVAVGLCMTPTWRKMSFNSKITITKPILYQKDNSCQIVYNVLHKPVYQILALIDPLPGTVSSKQNPAHAMRDILKRRIKKQQSYRNVFMGIEEFSLDYYGPPQTPIVEYSAFLPAVVMQLHNPNREMDRIVKNNLFIDKGVVHYEPSVGIVVENGILKFQNEQCQQQVEDWTC